MQIGNLDSLYNLSFGSCVFRSVYNRVHATLWEETQFKKQLAKYIQGQHWYIALIFTQSNSYILWTTCDKKKFSLSIFFLLLFNFHFKLQTLNLCCLTWNHQHKKSRKWLSAVKTSSRDSLLGSRICCYSFKCLIL